MPNATTMERIIKILPGYDRREQGEGVHGAQLRMVLVGPEGVVQFLLFTHWSSITEKSSGCDPR